jgi:hypothetical protein
MFNLIPRQGSLGLWAVLLPVRPAQRLEITRLRKEAIPPMRASEGTFRHLGFAVSLMRGMRCGAAVVDVPREKDIGGIRVEREFVSWFI